MDIFITIAVRIIKEQELIIGPLAWEEAGRVNGLDINLDEETLQLKGDKKQIINSLVKQYSRLFGRASQEVCKDAVRDIIVELPKGEVPSALE